MYEWVYPLPGASSGSDQPVLGGEIVGLEIGGAVLGVLAGAWCIRALKRMFNSYGDG
jgi:hypothetical protein